jgi:hypothetical protein
MVVKCKGSTQPMLVPGTRKDPEPGQAPHNFTMWRTTVRLNVIFTSTTNTELLRKTADKEVADPSGRAL